LVCSFVSIACDKEYHFPLEVSFLITSFSYLISVLYVYGWELARCDDWTLTLYP